MIVDVALPIPLKHALTYSLPEGLESSLGVRVAVPLGSRVIMGVIVGLPERSPAKVRTLKAVIKILDEQPALSAELLDLAKWMAGYYHCSWG